MINAICEQFRALIAHFEGPPFNSDAQGGISYEVWVSHIHDCQSCNEAVLAHRVRQLGHDPVHYPCIHMAYYATQVCEQHPDRSECQDLIIEYKEKFDEYLFIKYQVKIAIQYCPWCGIKLPPSQRDRWFDELEKLLGKSPFDTEPGDIPERYRTSAWFKGQD